jgi:hypothetical protein
VGCTGRAGSAARNGSQAGEVEPPRQTDSDNDGGELRISLGFRIAYIIQNKEGHDERFDENLCTLSESSEDIFGMDLGQ